MVGAPERRRAIQLFDHRQQHPCGIVHRRRVAAAIVGQADFVGLFGAAEETSQGTLAAVVEQPAEAQQHMLGAGRAYALLHAPDGLAALA
ncbi:hypothetical protein D3C80_2041270 [compost metagenome]